MPLTVLEEHEAAAAARLPQQVYEYFASGSGDGLTLRDSAEAWTRFRLRPRVLRDVGEVDLTTTILGADLAHPVGVAPAGFQGLAHEDGERAVARGAGATGGLYVVSTRSSTAIEQVAAEATGPWWFQVYLMRDREMTLRVVERAAAAGARALVVTGDTPYVGIKRRVGSQRIAIPDDHFLANVHQHLLDAGPTARAAAEQDPTATTDAIGWLARETGLPVLVKGVLRGDDAAACVAAGAAGIVVSNHGGRQLDRAVPSALALAEVVDAVGPEIPVLVDSGIRSGLDCLIALALGARAVLVGRPVVWGLAAEGHDGVARTLGALRDDLAHCMALSGAARLSELDRGLVVR